MKAIKTITLLALLAGLAVAQTSTSKTTTKTTTPAKTTTATKPATSTTATKPATTATKPATTTTATKPVTPTTKPATKPTTTATKPAPKTSPMTPKTAKTTKPTELAAPKKESTETSNKPSANKTEAHRDPFVSPVMARTGGGGPVNCETGKRCLVIDQLKLQGVVQTVDGMIAVVANPANRVYYLHETDPLWDGYVVKIMIDSKTQSGAVIFRQNVIDKVGQQSTRDVTKRVEAPAI